MHFSLAIIKFIILVSSPTLASDYALPLHLVSRQSSFFCVPVFLLYPDTWTKCGSGYISPLCNCCQGGLIGCLTLTQTCAIDATGGSICCDNASPRLVACQHLAVGMVALHRTKCTAVATAASQLDTGAVPMTLIMGAAQWSNIAVPTRMGRHHAV